MFMNNLSIVLLFTFICIKIATQLELPAVPVLVAAIIASNIGGAALPWADTPAVILTLYTDFSLKDFLTMLFLPCLFYAVLLVTYLLIYSKKAYIVSVNTIEDNNHPPDFFNNADHTSPLCEEKQPSTPLSIPKEHQSILPPNPPKHSPIPPPNPLGHHIISSHHPVKQHYFHISKDTHSSIPPNISKKHSSNPENTDSPPKNNKQTPQTIFLFILLIFGICIAPFINISISIIVMLCGSVLLFFDKQNPEDTINRLPVLDSLIFISTLFFIGTVLKISGILNMAVQYIIAFTGTNRYFIVLVIILSAFIIATFLSAGPAAATLLPICSQLTQLIDYRIIFTALALGILAGSSMFPWSATGGPILLGEVNRFLKQNTISKTAEKDVLNIFKLKHYLSFSVPFSLFILCSSILYLFLYIAISR